MIAVMQSALSYGIISVEDGGPTQCWHGRGNRALAVYRSRDRIRLAMCCACWGQGGSWGRRDYMSSLGWSSGHESGG